MKSYMNQAWAIDFVQDQVLTGRKLHILTIVDAFSCYAPAIGPRFIYIREDVAQVTVSFAIVLLQKLLSIEYGLRERLPMEVVGK